MAAVTGSHDATGHQTEKQGRIALAAERRAIFRRLDQLGDEAGGGLARLARPKPFRARNILTGRQCLGEGDMGRHDLGKAGAALLQHSREGCGDLGQALEP
jgi:hypothetical protein